MKCPHQKGMIEGPSHCTLNESICDLEIDGKCEICEMDIREVEAQRHYCDGGVGPKEVKE